MILDEKTIRETLAEAGTDRAAGADAGEAGTDN